MKILAVQDALRASGPRAGRIVVAAHDEEDAIMFVDGDALISGSAALSADEVVRRACARARRPADTVHFVAQADTTRERVEVRTRFCDGGGEGARKCGLGPSVERALSSSLASRALMRSVERGEVRRKRRRRERGA